MRLRAMGIDFLIPRGWSFFDLTEDRISPSVRKLIRTPLTVRKKKKKQRERLGIISTTRKDEGVTWPGQPFGMFAVGFDFARWIFGCRLRLLDPPRHAWAAVVRACAGLEV